jgi:DNA-binding CsgD family transcriptional regulator
MPKQMIGRDAELALVRGLLDDEAGPADHRLLLLRGEPGVGKSLLLSHLASHSRERGCTVLTGRAVPGGGAYRPIAEALVPPLRDPSIADSESLRPFGGALSRLVPGWAADAPVETTVDPVLVLGEGVLRLVGLLGGAGCVLAFEDLQWADPDSLALLDYLAGAPSRTPLLIAATVRDRPLVAAIERSASAPGTVVVDLAPLAADEVDRLVAALAPAAGDAERALIRDRSEGLPLLVEELVAELSRTGATGTGAPWIVPRTFAAIVETRLAGLDQTDRQLLAAAAVLGGQPDWDLVPRVAGTDQARAVAGLRRAVRAELLVSDGLALTWRHALTRDAVLAGLLPPERNALADRAADLLLDRAGPRDAAAALELLTATGDTDRAAALMVEMAARDLQVGALRSAETLLDRAAATGRAATALASCRVELLRLTGQLSRALEAGNVALAETTGNDHAELCLLLARTAIAAGQWADAEAYVVRAGRPEDVRSLMLVADAAHGAGRIAEAAEQAARAVELAEHGRSSPRGAGGIPAESDRAAVVCEALCIQARVARLSDPGQALEAFGRAAQLASEHGLRPWRVEALLGVGSIELLDEEHSAALLEARDLATELGLLEKATGMELIVADEVFLTNGPRAASQSARTLIERGRLLRLPVYTAIGELILATGAALAGDRQAVTAALAATAGPPLPPEVALQRHSLRGLAALSEHDLASAARHLDAAVEPLLGHGSVAPLHEFGLWALLRTVADDRGVEARGILRGMAVSLRAANRGALLYADAVAAGRAGQVAAAETAYATAEQATAPIGWWQRLLRLLALECAVVDGWGDSVPQLRADLRSYELAGEDRLARICRDLLRQAGAPTRRGRGDSEVPPQLRARGITSRELDVLRLVAAGHGNADIAQRLFLSSRTVETHVSNLLAKTGAGNRAELRDWLAGLTP